MSDSNDKVMSCLGLTVVFILGIIIRGWVLSVLWGWFVVPYFGLRMLSIPLALGLAALVYMLVPVESSKKSTEETVTGILVSPLIVLLYGFILHLFV